MELRHLRYFVAVAEEGSLTVAAEKRLHTAQPSLSRQLRDLEYEVGAQLFLRTSRGVELTPAGQAFLEHARLSLHQASEAVAAARRVARPAKTSFAVGFLTGQEVEWLRHVTHVLKEQLKDIDLRISSDFSPHVAEAVERGRVHVAGETIHAEPGVDEEGLARLERRGYEVRRWEARHHYFGGASVVASGGAAGDPRRSGLGLVLR